MNEPRPSAPQHQRQAELAAPTGGAHRWLAMAGVAVSALWLLNLSAGFVELPDNLPVIGNLDEVFFSGLLFASLAKLGIRLPWTPRPGK